MDLLPSPYLVSFTLRLTTFQHTRLSAMNSRKATDLLPPPSLLSFSHSGYSTVTELDTTRRHPGLGTNKLTTFP